MKKTGNIILTVLMGLWCVFSSTAQEPVFFASLDKNPVALGDVFSVRFSLENGRGEISPPQFVDFDVIFGPSTSSNIQIINGKRSSTMTVSYTLRPRAEGKFTIGKASARVGNKTLSSEPLVVEVVKGASASAPAATKSAPQGNMNDNNLMVRMQLSKNKVYQGEGIVVTFVLLSRYNNIDLGETIFPSFDGFWTEEAKTGPTSWEADFEYIKGVPYRKAILRQQLLYPQRAGSIEIEPFKLTGRVNRSIISMGTEVRAQSSAQTVEVLPLPGGAPPSFNGAVGEYSFSGTVGKTELQANDAIDLSISLKGKGNLKLAKPPVIDFPSDFEVYDPEIKDRLSTTAAGMSGSRTFDYLVIPRYPGKYDIPIIEFTHFNTVTERYITESVGPFSIEVKGEDGIVPDDQGAIARSRVEPMRRDIRYIATDASELSPKGDMFFRSVGFYVLSAGPLLLFLGFIVFHKKREALLGDVKTVRRKKAHRIAKKRLEAAKLAMDKKDTTSFYSEIFNAMYGFIADKLGTNKAELTKPLIKQRLADNAVPDHLIQEAIYIIETCEMARFAPVSGHSDQMFYNRVAEFIEKLEGIFK